MTRREAAQVTCIECASKGTADFAKWSMGEEIFFLLSIHDEPYIYRGTELVETYLRIVKENNVE